MRGVTSGSRLISVPVGTHTYAIADVQPNCTLSGAASGSVTLAVGDTVTVNADATCSAIGLGTVGTAVSDPAADTLPNMSGNASPALDLIGATTRYASGWFILVLHFTKPVLSSAGDEPTGLNGYIDLDVDENVNTGFAPAVNFFGGSAQQGSDYAVILFEADSVSVQLVKATGISSSSAGRVRAKFEGDSVIISIPLAKLGGDDGNLTVTTVIGTADRATDIAPNSGMITARVPSSIVMQKSTLRQHQAPERETGAPLQRSFGKWRPPR